MISNLETDLSRGDPPDVVTASDVALEAGAAEAEAAALIGAAWAQVETFTGKSYRAVTAAKVILSVSGPISYRWPFYPFPAAITADVLSGGSWVSQSLSYVPELGRVELEGGTYRLTQTGTVAGLTPPANVIQAVRNLALYQLVHDPARREVKSHSAGELSFTREALMGLFYGSGAGALLAGEVRL